MAWCTVARRVPEVPYPEIHVLTDVELYIDGSKPDHEILRKHLLHGEY